MQLNLSLRIKAAAAAALALVCCATPAQAAQPAPHRVVFILPGQGVGTLPYQPLAHALRGARFDARPLDLAGTDLRADAATLAQEVDRVRAEDPEATVSLVGHSAGGISARHYLKNLGGAEHTAAYVALGSPQYGSPSACLQPGTARDLCPGSGFLTELNAGDDTPGPTAYYALRSAQEWADGRLDGGQCRMTPIPHPFPPLGGGFHHSLEPLQHETAGAVIAALNGTCTGEYVEEEIDTIQAADTLFQDGV
ncbi:lipase [Corynebacterium mastitidis]|uniref:Lipase n=1 Tax=Corynebacterium mastitidis TaxID=161890 RepID=A0A2N0X907_9CORY|nr:lipase [Corynebacterium mastitidis]MCH6196427.1 lipase [Corynebacterium mastitidis]PKF69185.1 lipase [Corynebacterium mastitidis]